MISAASRESEQPKITAKGFWFSTREDRREASWLGCGGFAGNKTFVALAETAPGQGWSQVSSHEPYFTARTRPTVKLLRLRLRGRVAVAGTLQAAPALRTSRRRPPGLRTRPGSPCRSGRWWCRGTPGPCWLLALPESRSSQSWPPALRVPVTGGVSVCCRSQVGFGLAGLGEPDEGLLGGQETDLPGRYAAARAGLPAGVVGLECVARVRRHRCESRHTRGVAGDTAPTSTSGRKPSHLGAGFIKTMGRNAATLTSQGDDHADDRRVGPLGGCRRNDGLYGGLRLAWARWGWPLQDLDGSRGRACPAFHSPLYSRPCRQANSHPVEAPAGLVFRGRGHPTTPGPGSDYDQ